jgi:hypothetical protein
MLFSGWSAGVVHPDDDLARRTTTKVRGLEPILGGHSGQTP